MTEDELFAEWARHCEGLPGGGLAAAEKVFCSMALGWVASRYELTPKPVRLVLKRRVEMDAAKRHLGGMLVEAMRSGGFAVSLDDAVEAWRAHSAISKSALWLSLPSDPESPSGVAEIVAALLPHFEEVASDAE